MDEGRLRVVMETAYRDDECARALVSALGLADFEQIAPWLTRWLGSSAAFENYLGLAGCAVHRRDPGAALEALLAHPSARVQRRALRAAAELGRCDLGATLRELAQEPRWELDASLSLALLRQVDAEVLGALARAVHDPAQGWSAAGLLVALAPESAHERIRAWLRGGKARAALAGIEGSGDLRFMPDLIRLTGDDSVSHLAGEVFRSLMGVDLDHEDLERDPPFVRDPDAADLASPRDEPVGPRLYDEEVLSWPAELSLTRWWRAHRDELDPGMRYLAGQPVGSCANAELDADAWTTLCTIVCNARPRQRTLAAQRLKLARPDLASVETHAFVGRARLAPGLDQLEVAPRRAHSLAETERA
jgi:uncharacterized protein (TIGR02270 family)